LKAFGPRGVIKKTIMVLLLFHAAAQLHAGHKIRLSLSGGYSLVNDLAGSGAFSISPKLTLAYPITPEEKDFNIELGVAGMYEAQLTGNDLRAPGFGFNIRIFYNGWGPIRPYFNHEILTRIILMNGRNNSATSFSVLLGLGADFPLAQDRPKETPSIFADLSYVFYNVGYFNTAEDRVKTLFLTAGYEIPF
jgi:hypothetical protein